MGKKVVLKIIVAIIVLIIVAIVTYFIIDKINQDKRDYELETVTEYNYFAVKTNEKYGVIDKEGKVVIEPKYDAVKIPNPSKPVFICYEGEKGKAYNEQGQQLYAEYNTVEPIELQNVAYDLPYEKSVLRSEKNGKYGLIDFNGNSILDTVYENIESFSYAEGQLQIKQNDKLGIVNIKGTELVKPEYDTIIGDNYYSQENGYKFSGYIVGQKHEDGYKYGYINYKGKLKLKLEYNDISRITDINDDKNAYLITAKNGQYGVNKNSKAIIKNEYQAIEYNNTNKIFILQKGENYGTANEKGDIVLPIENSSVQAKGQYIYAEKNDEKLVYDALGNTVNIDFSTTIMNTANSNYRIIVKTEGTSNFYGVVDANNNQIINTEYLYIEYAFDNYFIVCGKNGKLGVLDDKGNTVIDLKYDLTQKVQGKNIIQTLIAETNTTELYSPTMEKICIMDNATVENEENYIKVYSDTNVNYFNNDGIEEPSSKIFTNNKLFAKVQNGMWGYIDQNGETRINFEYEMATEFNEYGYAAIKKDGKWGCINSAGEIVVEPKYEIDSSYGEIEFLGEYLKIQSGFGDVYYTNDI